MGPNMRAWKGLILRLAGSAFASFPAFESCTAFASCGGPTVEEVRIQMRASSAETPGRMKQPPIAPNIGCDRPFIHRGEVYSVDSPQAQDASTLRSHVSEVPEAKALLDSYQRRRELSRISAYTGSVGIFMMILANSVLRRANPESTAGSLKSVFQIGGLALTAGGFLYSFSLLRTNERLIPEAVDAWNRARPEDKIELKFEAGWRF